MKKIERPYWHKVLPGHISRDQDNWLNNWFNVHIEPINKMLEAGVEVYQERSFAETIWDTDPDANNMNFTHKALLINIEPIKQETAADVLRDIMYALEINNEELGEECLTRAKAALEREDDR
jgi:hypothetical protein